MALPALLRWGTAVPQGGAGAPTQASPWTLPGLPGVASQGGYQPEVWQGSGVVADPRQQLAQLQLQLQAIQAELATMIQALPAQPAVWGVPAAPAPVVPPPPPPPPAPAPPPPPVAAPAPPPMAPAPAERPQEGSGPLLKKGATGEPVKKLQDRLRALGCDPGATDGAFGPKTEAAVKAFQRKERIAVDGVVGPDTWKHLGIKVDGNVNYPAAAPSGTNSGSKTLNIGGPQPAVIRQGHFVGLRIADRFDRMVAAAKADGVSLVIESGYRTHAEQQALWNANPNPRYVARPGTSNHEQGNAIDFKNTPGAWAWLKRNAARFGMYNYPPEPWHYSIDGR